MRPRIVILGGGAGGTVAANLLAGTADVTLVDNHGLTLFQAGLLPLSLDGGSAADLEHDLAKLLRPDVKLRVGRVKRVDPDKRVVTLEEGTLEYDWLILATGSRVNDAILPGFRDHANHFHCPPAAEALAEKLSTFKGGRVVIGAASLPYKCPPTPVEFALLFEEKFRGRVEITYTYPTDGVLMRPDISKMARPWLEEQKIRIETSFVPASIEPKAIISTSGKRLDFDLLVLVPPHAAAPFLRNSPLAGKLGFVPTDKFTLKVRDRIYAIGDTAEVPVPKTAAAAMAEARVAATNITAEISGTAPIKYDGHVLCYMGTGGRTAAQIEFTYDIPPAPLERKTEYFDFKPSARSYFADLAR